MTLKQVTPMRLKRKKIYKRLFRGLIGHKLNAKVMEMRGIKATLKFCAQATERTIMSIKIRK